MKRSREEKRAANTRYDEAMESRGLRQVAWWATLTITGVACGVTLAAVGDRLGLHRWGIAAAVVGGLLALAVPLLESRVLRRARLGDETGTDETKLRASRPPQNDQSEGITEGRYDRLTRRADLLHRASTRAETHGDQAGSDELHLSTCHVREQARRAGDPTRPDMPPSPRPQLGMSRRNDWGSAADGH
jgi:hypothetical protein